MSRFMLVATVKDEGPYILEWVAHHRLCGFDPIVVYQNDSTDTTQRTLRVLARLGVIQYFDNVGRRGGSSDDRLSPRGQAQMLP